MAELTRTTQEAVGETHEEQLVHAENDASLGGRERVTGILGTQLRRLEAMVESEGM